MQVLYLFMKTKVDYESKGWAKMKKIICSVKILWQGIFNEVNRYSFSPAVLVFREFCLFDLICFFFKTGSHHAVLACLELVI